MSRSLFDFLHCWLKVKNDGVNSANLNNSHHCCFMRCSYKMAAFVEIFCNYKCCVPNQQVIFLMHPG